MFYFSPETIENPVVRETLVGRGELILKVKKPDYLGDSKWKFKYDKQTFTARILDEDC